MNDFVPERFGLLQGFFGHVWFYGHGHGRAHGWRASAPGGNAR